MEIPYPFIISPTNQTWPTHTTLTTLGEDK